MFSLNSLYCCICNSLVAGCMQHCQLAHNNSFIHVYYKCRFTSASSLQTWLNQPRPSWCEQAKMVLFVLIEVEWILLMSLK